MTSVLDMLRGHAARAPGAPAILAPGRSPTSYGDLTTYVESIGAELRRHGISPSDRVALVVPNGPALAVAVLGAISVAQCAPLAPDHPRPQFDRELTRLRARAVIVQRGADTAARAAAAGSAVHVIELDVGDAAGACALAPARRPLDASDAPVGSPEAALLLFTSCTTSDPKLVPLTEGSLLRSAATVARTVHLEQADRCLNVMPLFHIHGLVAGLLASLTVGGSVVCTPGFRADAIAEWLEELRPTWYTAVPTVHQAMLDVAKSAAIGGAFRLIRSSSAPLPLRVLRELEATFRVPVIEAYGMTEAAHQIASNPLPPEPRKPGTVGRSTGVDIAVLGADGRPLPAGSVGEIAIKGPTVTAGYLDNPEANASAFVGPWFRTGDEGRIDADGYVTITGRLKELINRGGEKVAPREVDEALLGHPDVRQASAFAIPHPRLGEEVGAAVVLRPGALATTGQLRTYVADQLEPFKVPRRIVVVDDIPRGPTGKIERRRLAASLGLDRSPAADEGGQPAEPPRDAHEEAVAVLWQRVLGLDELPSVTADFFDLGGDSLHATELLVEAERQFGRRLLATIFFSGATVRGMGEALRAPELPERNASIVPVQPGGARPPLFCLLRGGSLVAVRHFAAALGPDQPVYGIWYPAMHGGRRHAGSVEEIAAECLAVLRKVQPEEPYFLFGHSFGGVVMYDVARQLRDQGQVVGLLALADSAHPRFIRPEWRGRLYRLRRRLFRVLRGEARPAASPDLTPGSDIPFDRTAVLARERRYRPARATWPVAIFSTTAWREFGRGPDLGWKPLLQEPWTSDLVPGSHDSMIGEPHVHVLAARLGARLREAQRLLSVDERSPTAPYT